MPALHAASTILTSARTAGNKTFLFLAFLTLLTAILLLLLALRKKRRQKPADGFFIGAGVSLWLTVFLAAAFGISFIKDIRENRYAYENSDIDLDSDYGFEVQDGTEPLEVVTSRGCENINPDSVITPYRMVYDSCDLHYVLSKDVATAEDCLVELENNEDISPTYKAYFSDFIQRIGTLYPDANLAILCENLKTLKVVELEQMEFLQKSLSVDSYGCYLRTENVIYIPVGTEYNEGEWGFQVLIHEFCHAVRTRWVEYEDTKDRVQICSEYGNTLIEECMNSVFSCSLLSYDERNIAYQVPSNYLRIMLECMDNYTLDDYVNHSEVYFLKCLDEYTGYTNYAQVIWNLITLQRSEWEDGYTDISPSKYEPLYDYLCHMYYEKYITPDMTEEEGRAIAAELIDKAFYDAPEGYNIDPDYFYEYLELFRQNQNKTD